MKIKSSVLIISATAAVLLTGCSSVNDKVTDYVGEQLIQSSDVVKNENYQQYEKYKAAGMLDDNGYYAEETEDAEGDQEKEAGQIHVTFATNSNLEIEYATDDGRISGTNVLECYLNPGEQLRATVGIASDVYSSEYEFSTFRVYEWNGDKRTESSLSMTESNGEWVLDIPVDYTGTEMSIVPVGTYNLRTIAVDDYYVGDNGKHEPLSGDWKVNDEPVNEKSKSISSVESYYVTYEYDPNQYFVVTSDPSYYYNNVDDGIVTFREREASEETVSYSIELCKKFSIEFRTDAERKVAVIDDRASTDGSTEHTLKSGESVVLSSLEYGDTIQIKTDKAWDELNEPSEVTVDDPEIIEDEDYSYLYTLTIHSKNGVFTFDPAAYPKEHGTITFSCHGNDIKSKTRLASGDKLYYRADLADEGYWLPGDDNYIIISDDANKTTSDIEAIELVRRVPVNVHLPQPAEGGEIIYYTDSIDKPIDGQDIELDSGTTIHMKFVPWLGWECTRDGKGLNDDTYEVNDSEEQIVSISGKKIEKLFDEKDEHKPVLTITLDNSLLDIPNGMTFSVAGEGYASPELNVKSGITANNTYSDGKPGTNDDITVKILAGVIPSGSAIRMDVTKTIDSKEDTLLDKAAKITNIQYMENAEEKEFKPIVIYESLTSEEEEGHCSAIRIKLSLVDDVEHYSEFAAADNTELTVKNSTTGIELRQGDTIEPSQKVDVMISPLDGYYLVTDSGGKVKNGIYSKTLKYSEYLKDIESTIQKYKAAKNITITLGEADPYATYTYKLNGTVVSGTLTTVQAGEKLELTYSINEGEPYQLTEKHGGFAFGWGASTSQATESITVTNDMDGKTVDKDLFNIATQKGE